VLVISSYGIGGSCMDKIAFSVLWHDWWIAWPRNKSTTHAHAFYRLSEVDCITKNRVSKKKGHALRLLAHISVNKQNFLGFFVLSPKTKVFATGLHAFVYILGPSSNCCCTADVYRTRLIFLVAQTRSYRGCQ